MYRVEIIILLLFSLCSCQQGEKGEEIGLFHKQIDLEENLILGAPVDMKCVDDNLIIIDANSDAFFIGLSFQTLSIWENMENWDKARENG